MAGRPKVKKEVTPEEIMKGDIYEEEKVLYVRLRGMILRPDSRQYRQNSIEFDAHELEVAISVPDDPKFIIKKSGAEFALTPAGLFYIQQQIEQPYLEQAQSEKVASTDDDWGDEETPKAESTKDSKATEEDWDDGPRKAVAKATGDPDNWDDEKEEKSVEDEDWS